MNKELFNLLIGRPGGETSAKIIDAILLKPQNANQLANLLNLNYKTIQYHLKIICNHQYATKEQFGKYTYYHPSDKLIKNLDEYYSIKRNFQKK